MNITKISYSRVFALSNNETETIGMEAELEGGDLAFECMRDLKGIVVAASENAAAGDSGQQLQPGEFVLPPSAGNSEAPEGEVNKADTVTLTENNGAGENEEAPPTDKPKRTYKPRVKKSQDGHEASAGSSESGDESESSNDSSDANESTGETETPAPLDVPPPDAARQTIEWFTARIGNTIWMQGSLDRADQFTGPYKIEGPEFPEYMEKWQDDGFTYRDLTPEESNPDAAAATATPTETGVATA